MTDRRRINGPPSGTYAPVFTLPKSGTERVQRTRKPNQLRKIYLEVGVVSTATGSAYLELEPPTSQSQSKPHTSTPSQKLSIAVHGPKPLPRAAAFSPNLQLSTTVKFAPFATPQRRGYVRDALERDLGTQLETALNGVILLDRWPKSALDVVVTVLEAEDASVVAERDREEKGVQVADLNLLSGCITAASAALIDAGIDCLDLITGGVAATVRRRDGSVVKLLDPCPAEGDELVAACVVGYMATRDEVTLTWAKGDVSGFGSGQNTGFDDLLDGAINAARGSCFVLKQVVADIAKAEIEHSSTNG